MFPIYRKSIDLKNYYKILNQKEFIQLKIIGTKIRKYHYIVDKYPEIIMLKEMIDCENEFYAISQEIEFNNKELLI
jgi:hypothetical protein